MIKKISGGHGNAELFCYEYRSQVRSCLVARGRACIVILFLTRQREKYVYYGVSSFAYTDFLF
jgi:hypothetical protein